MTLCFLAKQSVPPGIDREFRPQIYLLAKIDSPLSVGRVAILPLISLSSSSLSHRLLTFPLLYRHLPWVT